MNQQYEHYMQHALALAQQAEALGEVPVGAVVVKHDEIIGEGFNQPISGHDPSAHAEIVALRHAAHALGNYRLIDCDLYVTLEPCLMCAGAIVHARIRNVIYGASDPKSGAAGTVFDTFNQPFLNHHVMAKGGLMAEACSEQLRAFFRGKR